MFDFLSKCLLVTFTAILGCGSAPVPTGPILVPVEGTLTLDGKPLPFKSLLLSPIDGTRGKGAAGYTNGQGRFRLMAVISDTLQDLPGCPPGHYRVIVTEPMIPISEEDFKTASQSDTGESREPAVALLIRDPIATSNVPDIYTSENTTPLEIEIRDGNEALEIELDSKAAQRPASLSPVQPDEHQEPAAG